MHVLPTVLTARHCTVRVSVGLLFIDRLLWQIAAKYKKKKKKEKSCLKDLRCISCQFVCASNGLAVSSCMLWQCMYMLLCDFISNLILIYNSSVCNELFTARFKINTKWQHWVKHMHRITLLPSSSLPNPVLSVSYHFFSRTNTQGVIIHGYTVTIISNGTIHPLDPLLSIHLLKHCYRRPVACDFLSLFSFANLLREVIEAHIHSCF